MMVRYKQEFMEKDVIIVFFEEINRILISDVVNFVNEKEELNNKLKDV